MKKEIERPFIEVGSRIRTIRKVNDLTQKEFGDRIFVSQDLISLMERGLQELQDQNCKLICDSFHISEKWLIHGEGDMYQSITKNLSIKDKDIERVIAKLLKLQQDDLLFVEDILDKFIERKGE